MNTPDALLGLTLILTCTFTVGFLLFKGSKSNFLYISSGIFGLLCAGPYLFGFAGGPSGIVAGSILLLNATTAILIGVLTQLAVQNAPKPYPLIVGIQAIFTAGIAVYIAGVSKDSVLTISLAVMGISYMTYFVVRYRTDILARHTRS